ncbi:MAG: hypothetical protein HY898_22955 [Deltaproteobacteria bacterium]|nr:hypothetical protein [Deltaproteobacteria bacterium]
MIETHGRLLHVGYLAASTPNPAVGLPSLLVILLGLFAFSMAFVRRTRWRRALAVAGGALVLGGVGGSWWAYVHQIFQHPEYVTVGRIVFLQDKLVTSGEGLPADIRAAVLRFEVNPEFANDGWGRCMRLERGANSGPTIRSAGRDGVFGTEDDVTTAKALGSKWGSGMSPEAPRSAPTDDSALPTIPDR